MKKITITTILALMWYCTSLGQNDIQLEVSTDNTDVLLRWAPQDFKTWDNGRILGYQILKSTVAYQGTRFGLDTIIASERIISSIMPNESGLRNETNNQAQLAVAIAFDSIEVLPASGTFADAVKQRRDREDRYIYYMLAADQSFDMACLMGVGYKDVSNDPDTTYAYRLVITVDDSTSYTSNIREVTLGSPTTSMTAPYNLEGHSFDQEVTLQWFCEERCYSFYDIERSTDGQTFSVVNTEPFAYMPGLEDESGQIQYQDKGIENNVDYYYRVRGKSYFGSYGPYSDTIIAQGKPDKYLVNISVDSFTIHKGSDEVSFFWRVEADSATSVKINNGEVINQFNIIAQEKTNDTITVLNDQPYAATTTKARVQSPYPTGYYTVEMFDQNGAQYLSLPQLVQFPDSIAPEVPTGLTGTLDKAGSLHLEWDANTDSDLDGYMVYFSTDYGKSYQVLVPELIRSNRLSHSLQQGIHIDSVTFAVTAIDYRFNESAYSQPYHMAKPDVNPPTSAVITEARPTKDGIRLGWILSQDKDVKVSNFERRKAGSLSWKLIKHFPPGMNFSPKPKVKGDQHAVYHIDSLYSGLGALEYRIQTVDKAGNVSFSKIKKVYPYDDGIRGRIIDPYATGAACYVPGASVTNQSGSTNTAMKDCVSPGSNSTNGGTSGTGIGGGNGNSSGNHGTSTACPCTLIAWMYDTQYTKSLIAFKIFRVDLNTPDDVINANGNTQEVYRLIKTIRLPQAEETADAFTLDDYFAFVDENGTKPGAQPIKYKVIAEHRDGGMSTWSAVFEVQ